MISFPGVCSALVRLPRVGAGGPESDEIARVLGLERSVLASGDWIRETVPAFNTLLIEGDPLRWDPDEVSATVAPLVAECLAAPPPKLNGMTLTLPACYEAELAPDLEQLAASSGLSAERFASLHSASEYTVLATGFAPGFAYLGSLDPRLAHPRRADPRPRVEVGSVGIADRRTGVYPAAGPGGWQLIGRVPAPWFADVAQRIARFEPGMRVRFRPIDQGEYAREGGE